MIIYHSCQVVLSQTAFHLVISNTVSPLPLRIIAFCVGLPFYFIFLEEL